MSTQFYAPPFNADIPHKKFDMVNDGAFLYATQDLPPTTPNKTPTLQVSYIVTGHQRVGDITTVYFTQTGTVTNFARGSIIKCAGMHNASMNFTGMCLDGGSNWASYVNPGYDEALWTGSEGTAGGPNPAWTSGCYFTPTYTTKINTENQAIVTQLGGGYSQRVSNGLNTFNQNVTMVFQNRNVREGKAIANYVQDSMGVRACEIMLADPFLNNQPTQKWVLGGCDVSPVSYSLCDVTVQATRVYDP